MIFSVLFVHKKSVSKRKVCIKNPKNQKKKKKFSRFFRCFFLCFWQCCRSGMFIPDPGSWFLPIPDPGSKNSNKRERWKKISYHTFLCSHKFHKIVNYFSFEVLKKYLGQFSKNYRTFYQNFFLKIWSWDPGSRIQGSKRHRIPDPDPQHWFLGGFFIANPGWRRSGRSTRTRWTTAIRSSRISRPRTRNPFSWRRIPGLCLNTIFVCLLHLLFWGFLKKKISNNVPQLLFWVERRENSFVNSA